MKNYRVIHDVLYGVELVIEKKISVHVQGCDRGTNDTALFLDYFKS